MGTGDPRERERRLRQELHATLKDLSAELDPLELVGDVPVVEDFADDLAQARIADARAAGASWAEISERLGVSRQAAHKRFSGWRKRSRGIGSVIELRFVRDRKGQK
jgi:hypothetical protein